MEEQDRMDADQESEEIDLSGHYERKLDAKGRLSLPAVLKDDLSGALRVFPAPDVDALYVYPRAEFKSWIDRLFEQRGGFNERKREDLRLRRKLNAMAMPTEVDNAGRISIPEDIREMAGIGRDVMVVGNTDHLEIWDLAKWREEDDALDEDMEDLFFGL